MSGVIRKKEIGEAWETVLDTGGGGGDAVATVISNTDPGAIGAGGIWVDTSVSPPQIRIRRANNTEWYKAFTFDQAAITTLNAGVGPNGSINSSYQNDDQGALQEIIGLLVVRALAANTADYSVLFTTGSPGSQVDAWGLLPGGQEFLSVLPEPADGDVQTSWRAQWYDDSAGKPVLRFKEKDSADAVTTGVSLSCSGEQATVGAPGGGAAVPATASTYLKVRDTAGNLWVIPAFAAS